MSSIRNRTSAILARCESVLQAGIAAQISAINTDLSAASAPYRLPSVAEAHIYASAQGPELPEHLPDAPTVKIVALSETVAPSSANRLGSRKPKIEISIFLRYDHLLGTGGAGTVPTTSFAKQAESLLVKATNDLMEAARLALCSPTSGLVGQDGVLGAFAVQSFVRLQEVGDDAGVIPACAAVLAFAPEQRINYF